MARHLASSVRELDPPRQYPASRIWLRADGAGGITGDLPIERIAESRVTSHESR